MSDKYYPNTGGFSSDDFDAPESGVPIYSNGKRVGRTSYGTGLTPPDAEPEKAEEKPLSADPYAAYGVNPYAPAPMLRNPQPSLQPYGYNPAPGTNGLAIGSLVTGIVGLGPIPLIMGIVSLRQIERTGESGKGMAIAGIVLGSITTFTWTSFIGLFVLAVGRFSGAG